MANTENNSAKGEQQQEQQVMKKGMTFETLLDSFDNKLTKEKTKAFEQKFGAKFKELDAAEAIAANVRKELEKMFAEFQASI